MASKQEYCVQDVRSWPRCSPPHQADGEAGLARRLRPLEHDVQRILARQEERGFAFDEEAAHRPRRADEAQAAPREELRRPSADPRETPFYPKRTTRPWYVKGSCSSKKIESSIPLRGSRSPNAQAVA